MWSAANDGLKWCVCGDDMEELLDSEEESKSGGKHVRFGLSSGSCSGGSAVDVILRIDG